MYILIVNIQEGGQPAMELNVIYYFRLENLILFMFRLLINLYYNIVHFDTNQWRF